MFRPMRRNRQQLSAEECLSVLESGSSGVLALSGDDDYPYAVPMSYALEGDKLYFHCAKSGHKLDAIGKNSRASFCVVAQDRVSPEEYTSHYKSVIVFGRLRVMEDEIQKLAAIRKLCAKYAPDDSMANRERIIAKEWSALCILEMSIEHISGKQARELMLQ